MFIYNNWYGSRTIFSEYCKTKDKNAFAGIQHGLMTRNSEKFMGKSFSLFSFTPFLCWNKRTKNSEESRG
jgi:hypothetical protein